MIDVKKTWVNLHLAQRYQGLQGRIVDVGIKRGVADKDSYIINAMLDTTEKIEHQATENTEPKKHKERYFMSFQKSPSMKGIPLGELKKKDTVFVRYDHETDWRMSKQINPLEIIVMDSETVIYFGEEVRVFDEKSWNDYLELLKQKKSTESVVPVRDKYVE